MTFPRSRDTGLLLFLAWFMVATAWCAEPQATAPSQATAPAKGSQEASTQGVATVDEQQKVDAKPAPTAAADGMTAASDDAFLRVRRDENDEPLALETSVTRYVSSDPKHPGLTVDLIGAVHVGEKEYYEELNQLFSTYDAVLYELVAPKGTRVVPGAKPTRHPVSFLQYMMKRALDLEFQLDRIDYSKPNMVHADMSPDQFAKSMEDRNESFLKMFLQLMRTSMAVQAKQQNANSDIELLIALVAKDRAYRLKRLMAGQFENMEGQMSALNGPEGSTIITERNKKAFEVLGKEIEKGTKRLAVFYGAGHLSDMENRLLSEFGMKRSEHRWLEAWSLTRAEPAPAQDVDATPGTQKASTNVPH